MHFFDHTRQTDLLMVVIVVCVGLSSFALGRLSVETQAKEPVVLETLTLPNGEKIGGKVVASENSTKFHYPWCSGAKRIKDENMIQFSSIEEALASGYEPAENCPGL